MESAFEDEEAVDFDVDVEEAAGVDRMRRYKSPCGLVSSLRRTFKIAFPAFCRGAKSSFQNSESSVPPGEGDCEFELPVVVVVAAPGVPFVMASEVIARQGQDGVWVWHGRQSAVGAFSLLARRSNCQL
jgi:hypothetical protein